jgi:hypothetical protein
VTYEEGRKGAISATLTLCDATTVVPSHKIAAE